MKLVHLVINGRRQQVEVTDDELLLDTLRDTLGITSARLGCGVGACGACTVLVGGRSVSSCLALTARYDDGSEILTADGLPDDDDIVESFVAAGALQCGYCIPAFVLMARELLEENPSPTRKEIAAHLEGNICRCGTYPEICVAIENVAQQRARS